MWNFVCIPTNLSGSHLSFLPFLFLFQKNIIRLFFFFSFASLFFLFSILSIRLLILGVQSSIYGCQTAAGGPTSFVLSIFSMFFDAPSGIVTSYSYTFVSPCIYCILYTHKQRNENDNLLVSLCSVRRIYFALESLDKKEEEQIDE